MNYVLLIGLIIFSSASGALLVALLHLTRRDPSAYSGGDADDHHVTRGASE
jgi:hypothetical protein